LIETHGGVRRGCLYAVAAALLVIAILVGVSSSPPRRYQFSTGTGIGVWRGDTFTGKAVICASSAAAQAEIASAPENKGLMRKC
jgi:hypothetical protein